MRSAHRSITLVTAPASEPLSLQEVKNWAKIDTTADDELLVALIAAARAAAEQYLRRSLISQTHKLTLDLGGSGLDDCLGDGVYELPVSALDGGLPRAFLLPKGPLQSVTSIKTYDTSSTESTYSSSNYYVDAAGDRVVLNDTAVWPSPLRPRAACAITYVAGYGASSSDVPQPIKTAMMMHITGMYENRGACDQSALPAGAKLLLNQYRIMGEQHA